MKKLSAVCLLALAPTLGWASFVSSSSAIDADGHFAWTYSMQRLPVVLVKPDPPRQTGATPQVTTSHALARTFTILDFEGYVSGSCVGPAGWVCSAEFSGDAGADLLPDGDADIVNLTWSYLGGPRAAGWIGARARSDFSAQSIHGGVDTVSYIASNFNGWSNALRPADTHMGFTQGPTAHAVPEPGSLALALAGLGLVMAGVARAGWRRRPPA